MKEEYIIINKSQIEKRIEELEKIQNIHSASGHFPNFVMYEKTLAEKHTLQYLLSQSTPLIPQIEKAFDAGELYGREDMQITIGRMSEKNSFSVDKQDYISNLKLDI